MLNQPPKEILNQLPQLYANEQLQTPIEDTIIHAHFFCASADWWVAEYDGEDIFWGFANLGDDDCAEWGYASFSELRSIGESVSVPIKDANTGRLIGRMPLMVEFDEYWTPKPFHEINWSKQR
jgi:hypothetical protein